LPVPRVASETNAAHSPHHGLGSRRDARAEAKQQSTPFEALLDDTGAAPPASPRDHAERPRPRPSSAADGASDIRPDRRVRDRHDNRADTADGGDRSESADAQQPAAEAKPEEKPEETSAAAAADTADECNDQEETAATDTIDATLLAAAADGQAQQQPDVGEQAPAVPVATLAQAPVGAADATDLAATADAAIEAAGARNAQVPGASSGADVDAESGPEKGVKNAADIGSQEAAGVGAEGAEADAEDETGHKRTGEPNAANASGTVDADKTPRAKPSARAEKAAAAAGSDTAAPARPGDNAEAATRAGADATGKSEQAGADPVRPPTRNTVQKPDDAATRLHADTPAGATADGSKPPIDAAQLASVHPADRFANAVSAAAAQGSAQAGATGSAAVPVAGLAIEIAARAQAGNNRFDIRLDPPELGRIDVRLDVDRSGQVTTRLVVEKAETLDLLRRDAPELERALQQAGLKTGDSGLQFALRDQTAGGQDSGENWRSNVAKLVVSDPEMTAAETAAAGYGRSLRLGTGIDIRV
jgi:flagellar hook-length control protein FliK